MGNINLYTDVIHSNLTIKSSIKMATPQCSLINRYTPPIAAKFTYKKSHITEHSFRLNRKLVLDHQRVQKCNLWF
jgi:hypothetical protein